MRHTPRFHSVLFPILAAAIACGGCTTILQKPDRKETESMLTTAGFKMSLADSPAELEILKSKPQRKIIPMQRGQKLYYGYTDAKGCGCAYLGDEAAYKQYETYVMENRAIDAEDHQRDPDDAPVSVITVYDDDEWEAWGGDTF